ncbi:hypothetical protein [Streptomyces diastaticus]
MGEALYKAAQFEISGLNEWWPIPGPTSQEDRHSLSEVHVNIECEDGWVAKIGVSGMEATGPYSHSITKWVTILVERDNGFTLPILEDEFTFGAAWKIGPSSAQQSEMPSATGIAPVMLWSMMSQP